jgi:hypothetical protein
MGGERDGNLPGKALSQQLPWQASPETRLRGYLEAHHDLIFTRKVVCERGLENIICLPILLLASLILSPRAFASENLEEKKNKTLFFLFISHCIYNRFLRGF